MSIYVKKLKKMTYFKKIKTYNGIIDINVNYVLSKQSSLTSFSFTANGGGCHGRFRGKHGAADHKTWKLSKQIFQSHKGAEDVLIFIYETIFFG